MFSRSEVIDRASAHFGRPVPKTVFAYALHVGAIERPEKRGGWFVFTQRQLDQFIDYLENRSRLGFSSPSRQR